MHNWAADRLELLDLHQRRVQEATQLLQYFKELNTPAPKDTPLPRSAIFTDPAKLTQVFVFKINY